MGGSSISHSNYEGYSSTTLSVGFLFGGSSITLGGYKLNKSKDGEEEINAHPYKGYLVANIDDFNNMELLSEKLGNKTFKTYYLYSKFNEEMQKKYEDEALLKNYKIEVHHPIIYITDGNKGIYLDWLKTGFCIRYEPLFKIYANKFIGNYPVNEIMSACKNNSKNLFKLETNNCIHWANNVITDLMRAS